jgi:hypothetical protein
MGRRRSESAAHWRNSAFKPVGILLVGKSARGAERWEYAKSQDKAICVVTCFQENPLSSRQKQPVPQTDTGRQVEYTKALGWAVAKELGKLTL